MLRSGYEEDAEDLAEYVQRETGSEYIMNHPYRASSGSEEWHSSVVRQFLNGDNTNILGWWKRQGMYDRQPAEIQKSPYFLDANPFRYELDDDFVTVLGKVKKKTAKHQFFGGEIVATEDLFFLPAASELNPSTAEVDEGDVYSYYKGFSGNMYAKNFAGTTSTDEQWTRSVAWRPDGHPSSYGVSNVLSTLWGMVVPGLGSGNRAARSYCYMAPICNIV